MDYQILRSEKKNGCNSGGNRWNRDCPGAKAMQFQKN